MREIFFRFLWNVLLEFTSYFYFEARWKQIRFNVACRLNCFSLRVVQYSWWLRKCSSLRHTSWGLIFEFFSCAARAQTCNFIMIHDAQNAPAREIFLINLSSSSCALRLPQLKQLQAKVFFIRFILCCLTFSPLRFSYSHLPAFNVISTGSWMLICFYSFLTVICHLLTILWRRSSWWGHWWKLIWAVREVQWAGRERAILMISSLAFYYAKNLKHSNNVGTLAGR